MLEWFSEYVTLFFKDREASYHYKHLHIPSRLYKYQPISDSIREIRINTIKENKLWLSKATELNDPFDCQPTYFKENALKQFIEEKKISEKVGKTSDEIIDFMNQTLAMFKKNMKVVCFTESQFNMPMWGNYADNHKGICIEYNFKQLNAGNDFIKMLYPVGYDSKRYDITNFLKSLTASDVNSNPYILFFLMMMKHESWAYEKEWRVLDFDFEETTGMGTLINCPVRPSAIYFGMNCNQGDIEEISSIVDRDINLHKLEMKNHEFFHLDLIK